MIKYLLFLTLTWLCYCQLGALISGIGTIQVEDFKCLASKKLTFVSFGIYGSQSSFPTNIQGLQNARAANYLVDLHFFPDARSSPNQIATIMEALPANLYGMIWIVVSNWSSFTDEQACSFLKKLIQIIKDKGKRPGVAASYTTWNSFMNNTCKDLGSEYLKYYSTHTNYSFDDFEPFGGWTHPTQKIIQVQFGFCSQHYRIVYRQ